MRETRLSGSEGGGVANPALPTPIIRHAVMAAPQEATLSTRRQRSWRTMASWAKLRAEKMAP